MSIIETQSLISASKPYLCEAISRDIAEKWDTLNRALKLEYIDTHICAAYEYDDTEQVLQSIELFALDLQADFENMIKRALL